MREQFRPAALLACFLTALLLSSCQELRLPDDGFCCAGNDACGDKARVCARPTVRALAHDLDELERHIERYGSIVAKQPDVWGQARLTKHRQEFETVMAAEKDQFTDTLQGSLARSDQAYFADAFALSAAASSSSAVLRPPARVVVANATNTNAVTPNTLTPQPLPDQSSTFATFNSVSRTAVTAGPQLGYAVSGKSGIQLEPTIHLDQKARFLNHLHELRRINEGDDTADSPGYSLNLVRIPISVLPGKFTDCGHGAEVSMTLTPHLGEELLPTTFRNLLLNDLLDQIGFPVTQFINNPENSAYLAENAAPYLDELLAYLDSHTLMQMMADPSKLNRLRFNVNLQALFARPEWAWVDDLLAELKRDPTLIDKAKKLEEKARELQSIQSFKPMTPQEKASLAMEQRVAREQFEKMAADPKFHADMKKQVQAQRAELVHASAKAAKAKDAAPAPFLAVAFPVPATKSRRARMPFPPAQLIEIYGDDFSFLLVSGAYRALSKERFIHPCPDSGAIYLHLPDVQGYLQEEQAAAQKFLADPANADLWQFCTQELVTAIRSHQAEQIQALRESFRALVAAKSDTTRTGSDQGGRTVTAALAWATIVESALLTDQLVQDIRESAAAKGCACSHPVGWLDFYHPNPSKEARQAFAEYVRCRWPMHVFAVDPVAQQQNLADTFSSRREMQLAMSLAFVSGQISASNMMRYARRIEFDFATIDINGTAIGFSHGGETFGWRFYPRFQTPDIEGNGTVLVRDLFLGGPNRNALLRQRRLEPGMRECVAIVMMPSFVPYADLEVASDWFSLTNPKHKLLNSAQAMRLSKAIKSIHNCAGNVGDVDCYRDGDFERLLAKARQLEERLPLQSAKVQVPYENTLGGFAMFNTGVTDLAPELIGWYGSSSVNPRGATVLFLVGNHFSVHQTKVIAGGQEVSSQELLSRQVMKVTIPPGLTTVGDANQQFVDVHLATPYGATPHLLIPVCAGAAAPPKPAAPGMALRVITDENTPVLRVAAKEMPKNAPPEKAPEPSAGPSLPLPAPPKPAKAAGGNKPE